MTTPIYYPSDKLHIGHALTTTMADTLARFKRMQGYDVWFLTGSDEHGQKIQRKAQEAGLSPQAYVDQIVAGFQELWRRLLISYDDFIRTTEERHCRTVQLVFTKLLQNRDLYKANYKGWYCVPCETFWSERELREGNCPDCGRSVELLEEESYFFRLGKYAPQLLAYIKAHPDFIQPVSRRNEMVNFIKGGLADLCVSRTSFDWGIPVPGDPRHVIYVWVDALTNYISALGYGTKDESRFKKYWPVAVHLVGKDIVRFHTVIWPAILMALGLPLPRRVFGHGWLLVEGGKMSKSKGNVTDPFVLIEKYGVDAVRYYLLREMPYGGDGSYDEETLVNRLNADLANDFGNLVSRTLAMLERFSNGMVPAPGEEEARDRELRELALRVPGEAAAALDSFDFSGALAAIWKLVGRANKYIEETAPWNLAKEEGDSPRLATVLYSLAETVRLLTILVAPFMPALPAKVWAQLRVAEEEAVLVWPEGDFWGKLSPGTRVERGEALFPRVGAKEERKVNVLEKQREQKEGVLAGEISLEEFNRVDLRVAEVLEAVRVPATEKLVTLKVRLGAEVRTVVAGIAEAYSPEELVGKKVIVVANLKPVKLRGITSQGMILAAVDGEKLGLLTCEGDLPAGAKVR